MKGDLPREELIKNAQKIYEESGGNVVIHFKWSCEKCNARLTFEEPNQCFTESDCPECGHHQVIKEGGYSLMFTI